MATPADPSADLMLRVQVGDAGAFEQLVTLWQDRLVTLFLHHTGDHSTAEDLAQEVFLRVYRAREGYRPTAKFSTWIHTIANNVASDLRQRAYRRKEHGVPTSTSGFRIALTPAGERLLSQMAARVAECGARQLGHLRPADLRTLIGLLKEARLPHEVPLSDRVTAPTPLPE
jgi:RNA polymerase sigma factor (sigma-70 family)